MLIFSLSGLMRSVSGAIGALVALIAIQPLVAPLVLVTVVPAVIAASQRGRLFHGFAFGMTPRDRERRYLAQILTERDAAKEVRPYNLARFLRARHDRLYDEHITELRATARRSLRFSLLADLAGSTIIAGAILLLLAHTPPSRQPRQRGRSSRRDRAARAAAVIRRGQLRADLRIRLLHQRLPRPDRADPLC
jgi:ATP-binding cassette, subfamily B, bacterial